MQKLLVAASLAAFAIPAAALDYPHRPITFIVPYSAGELPDTITRIIAEPMSEALGQQVIVENMPGAGGTLAAGEVAVSPADGYTVLMHDIGMSTAPSLYDNLPYTALEDFRTVGLITEGPMIILGRPDFEPSTLNELVEFVNANGDSVTYAHAGTGTASHLCGLFLMQVAGTKVTELPYPGTDAALTHLAGGEADFFCDQMANTVEQIIENPIKTYSITAPMRSASFPDVPTTAELGLPELDISIWHGLYVPRDTPDDVVQKLNEALKAALKDETVAERFGRLELTTVSDELATPAAHIERLQSQTVLWETVLRRAEEVPTAEGPSPQQAVEFIKAAFSCPNQPQMILSFYSILNLDEYVGDESVFRMNTSYTSIHDPNEGSLEDTIYRDYFEAPYSQIGEVTPFEYDTGARGLSLACKGGKDCFANRDPAFSRSELSFQLCDSVTRKDTITAFQILIGLAQ